MNTSELLSFFIGHTKRLMGSIDVTVSSGKNGPSRAFIFCSCLWGFWASPSGPQDVSVSAGGLGRLARRGPGPGALGISEPLDFLMSFKNRNTAGIQEAAAGGKGHLWESPSAAGQFGLWQEIIWLLQS